VSARARGFEFIADEGALTGSDVESLVAAGGYGVLNLRLSKNGGLSRVLSLAASAQSAGLKYQLGCMVGETGISRPLAGLQPRSCPRRCTLRVHTTTSSSQRTSPPATSGSAPAASQASCGAPASGTG